MLGSMLSELVYEELPLPVGIGRRAESRDGRVLRATGIGSSPVFRAGTRGLVDGMGRSR
jgi:hypothetical protein